MKVVRTKDFKAEAWTGVRDHANDAKKRHGFIDSQKIGMEVSRKLADFQGHNANALQWQVWMAMGESG